MEIVVNNKKESVPFDLTVAALLALRKANRAAVWVNGNQLLKSEYQTTVLCSGDQVKILKVIAGG